MDPTRSVTEWTLSPGPWSARVFLSWNTAVAVAVSQPFQLAEKYRFGGAVSNATDLCSLMKKAYLVLSCFGADEIFEFSQLDTDSLPIDGNEDLPYTTHTVHIDIQTPEIPFNLTLVDLPGTLHSSSANRTHASLVDRLVSSNLSSMCDVILVTIPTIGTFGWNCEGTSNSGLCFQPVDRKAFPLRLAREADPLSSHTMSKSILRMPQ
jgi:hypothetical protein